MDIAFNDSYDLKIRQIIDENPRNYVGMLKSSGFKNRYEDRLYLLKYIYDITPLLNDNIHTFKTRLYWAINHLTEFPKCANCGKELIDFNVKKLKDGYGQFCSRECQYSSSLVTDKIKQTCKNKYGCTCAFNTKSALDNKAKNKDAIDAKKYITHKANGSFNESKVETYVYQFLKKNQYPNLIRQYRSKEYPYACDFYDPISNTYIEYNGSWTHGGHPFDEEDADDFKKLQEWKNKDTPYFDNAIYTWTELDVEKREVAKASNLNYITLYNMDDVYNLAFQGHKYAPLFVEYDGKKLQAEFNYYLTKDVNGKVYNVSQKNLIVKTFQQDVFFKTERELFEDQKIRYNLAQNRCRYLNKTPDQLTMDDMVSGFKCSGIHYGYSHFNPLWFKLFIEQHNVKKCYDPCGGWGHRLLGALNLEQYIYNDLSKTTVENIRNIIDYFSIDNAVVYNNDARTFIPEEEFDAMFTCPPYYNVEHYECGDFASMIEFNEFIDSLFNVFMACKSCKTFGLVIREDLLGSHTNFEKRIPLDVRSTYLTTTNKKQEAIFIYSK